MGLTAAPYRHCQVLKHLAETHKSRPFSYLWVESGAQPGLEAAVGVGGCGAVLAFPLTALQADAARSCSIWGYGAIEESTAG